MLSYFYYCLAWEEGSAAIGHGMASMCKWLLESYGREDMAGAPGGARVQREAVQTEGGVVGEARAHLDLHLFGHTQPVDLQGREGKQRGAGKYAARFAKEHQLGLCGLAACGQQPAEHSKAGCPRWLCHNSQIVSGLANAHKLLQAGRADSVCCQPSS